MQKWYASPYVYYFLLSVSGIILPMASKENVKTVWDMFYLCFYGVSSEGFNLLIYLYFCTVFLGFVYLFQVYMNKIIEEQIYYLVIRYRSLHRWFFQMIKSITPYMCLLLFGLFTTVMLTGILEGKSLEPYVTITNSGIVSILYQFFINGYLQLLNYILISFIMLWLCKEPEYSLIALGLFLILGVPSLNQARLLPSALNSLGYVSGNKGDLLQITFILIGYLVIEIMIIYRLLNKKEIRF